MMRLLQPHRRSHNMRHLIPSSTLLRAALLGDAAASGGMGLLLTAAAHPMAALLALPEPLLRGAGLVLLPYAGLVAWLGFQPRLPRWMVRGVVGINLLWTLDSMLLLALGLATPTGLGAAFVLLQGVGVLGFALLQWAGLRRGAVLGAVAA